MNDRVILVDSYQDQMSPVYIDCFGRSSHSEVCVQCNGRPWHFVFDEASKRGRSFVAAMFLDRALLNERVIYRYPKDRRFIVLWESPKEAHFEDAISLGNRVRAVFTHDHELLSAGDAFHRSDYTVSWVNDGVPVEKPEKSKLVSFFGSVQHPNAFGYELRKAVANRFVPDPSVDCFGKGIQELEFKDSGIIPYCFSIAMENTQKDFYYTEKLIDCFVGKTVPIYWGCESIGDVFDERGIIQFQTIEELDEIIRGLTFEKYEQMRPYVDENARRVTDGRMGTYQDLYEKLAALMSPMVEGLGPWNRLRRSKFAAAVRYGFDSIRARRNTY